MRNRIFGKLHSRRGASFLLVLLFFLICALVASAVLMAAASNAGRIRSARTEHQLYLTVSSAARLLCDELTDCEYRGRYHYWDEDEEIKHADEKTLYKITHKYLEQKKGSYWYTGGSEPAKLASLLLDDFDYIFSKEFDKVTNMEKVTKLSLTSPTPHTLTITPEEAAGEALTASVMARLGEYPAVLEEYTRLAPTERERAVTDRMDVLDLIDEVIRPAAHISQVTIQDQQVLVEFSGVTLVETADIVSRLEASPLVARTTVDTAASEEDRATVDVDMLIELSGGEEAAQE